MTSGGNSVNDFCENQLIKFRGGIGAYWYDTSREWSDVMMFTSPEKCRYGIPSHPVPLRALGPDLLNILRQSYDNLTIMPKLRYAPIQLVQCRFPGPAISNAKILLYFYSKIYGSNFIKQHSETVIVWNYRNADCSLRKELLSFIIIFGTLSFAVGTIGERIFCRSHNAPLTSTH